MFKGNKTYGIGRYFCRFLFLFLPLLFLPLNRSAAQNVIPALKRDDFNRIHAWWHYHRDGVARDDTTALLNGRGFLFLRLKNPGAAEESNVGISEFQNIYGKSFTFLSAEVRVKLLTPLLAGSRGWGFWKSTKRLKRHSLAWFMQQKDPANAKFSWSLAGTVEGKRRKVKSWQPDNRWHVYRIERDLHRKQTRFFIDGKPFLITDGLVPKERLSFHLWIDNQVYSRKAGIRRRAWQGSEAMVVDYVQIRTREAPPAQPRIYSPRVVWYRRFNTILTSTQNAYSVGRYAFKTRGDSLYVLLSARAEDLRPYDVPDRLRVFIDDQKQPLLEIDGVVLKGQTRTLVKKIKLSAGQHHIRLTARATPLLYDVLLVEAQGGKVTVNVPAQGDSGRFSWRDTEPQTYLLYAAVTANEAASYDHIRSLSALQNADDRVLVRLKSTGKGALQIIRFKGNEILGDCNTKIVTGSLPPGKNELTFRIEGKAKVHRLFLIRWKK